MKTLVVCVDAPREHEKGRKALKSLLNFVDSLSALHRDVFIFSTRGAKSEIILPRVEREVNREEMQGHRRVLR